MTQSNTLYAIDSTTGTTLVKRNLGPGCAENGPNIGITSTPVIDFAKQIIYAMAYVNGSPPTYQLHALELAGLTDVVLRDAVLVKCEEKVIHQFHAKTTTYLNL